MPANLKTITAGVSALEQLQAALDAYWSGAVSLRFVGGRIEVAVMNSDYDSSWMDTVVTLNAAILTDPSLDAIGPLLAAATEASAAHYRSLRGVWDRHRRSASA
jgi:hypothetical protein